MKHDENRNAPLTDEALGSVTGGYGESELETFRNAEKTGVCPKGVTAQTFPGRACREWGVTKDGPWIHECDYLDPHTDTDSHCMLCGFRSDVL